MHVKVVLTPLLMGLLLPYQTTCQEDILPDDDIEDHPLSKNCLQCFCKPRRNFPSLKLQGSAKGAGSNPVRCLVMGGDPRNLPVAMMEGCFDNTCGVFRITIGYWEAANYRTKLTSNKTEYESCSKNAWCAMRTVQRYMRRYLPVSGLVTLAAELMAVGAGKFLSEDRDSAVQSKRPERLLCENALALHKFGSRRGHHNLTVSNRKKLFTCLHRYVSKWLEYDKP
ncbi:unnamed protein product [Chilo suppressalis]|uniref:lysozyme n=1 Tax=Chilo suppressalis TaxID=168631 RepID=A0ABN8BB89_CHISP|nr:unnamed protein product [Chilo suppressalis]